MFVCVRLRFKRMCACMCMRMCAFKIQTHARLFQKCPKSSKIIIFSNHQFKIEIPLFNHQNHHHQISFSEQWDFYFKSIILLLFLFFPIGRSYRNPRFLKIGDRSSQKGDRIEIQAFGKTEIVLANWEIVLFSRHFQIWKMMNQKPPYRGVFEW